MHLYVTLTQLFGWTHIYQLNFRHPHISWKESLNAFIAISIFVVIFTVCRDGGRHQTGNMTFCEIICWPSGYSHLMRPFYPHLMIWFSSRQCHCLTVKLTVRRWNCLFSSTCSIIHTLNQLSKWPEKEWHQFGVLFSVSLLPFRFLRTKNPGGKKCIERSQEGRNSLSWGDKKKMMYFTKGRPQLTTRHINTCLQHFETTYIWVWCTCIHWINLSEGI